MIDELVDELALHLRHMAAMEVIGETDDLNRRWEIFLEVICPPAKLREASRAAATAKLASKIAGKQAAA